MEKLHRNTSKITSVFENAGISGLEKVMVKEVSFDTVNEYWYQAGIGRNRIGYLTGESFGPFIELFDKERNDFVIVHESKLEKTIGKPSFLKCKKHRYRLMTPAEKKQWNVKYDGIGTWICIHCDNITKSM